MNPTFAPTQPSGLSAQTLMSLLDQQAIGAQYQPLNAAGANPTAQNPANATQTADMIAQIQIAQQQLQHDAAMAQLNLNQYGNGGMTPQSSLGAGGINGVQMPPQAGGGNTGMPVLGSLMAQGVGQGAMQADNAQEQAMALALMLSNRDTNTPSASLGKTGATTIQDIVDQAGSGYGSIDGFAPGNPSTDFLTSSGQPINEAFLSQNIWDNPQMAINMGGTADIGTPGYNNLANMGFDPYMVYLASGGDLTGTTGVQYANWLADLYKTMGTTADKGGGSIAAGPLLANLVSMPPDSDLGQQMSESPQVFYDMANGIIQAGGVSPMAEKAFKGQMANLYMEYLTYMSSGNANEILPINQWIAKQHPEVVDSWAGGM